MNSKKKLPPIVAFAVITTITSFVWISFEIIRSYTKNPEPSVSAETIEQLDPALDIKTLEILIQRIHLEDSEIGEISTADKKTDKVIEGKKTMENKEEAVSEIIEQEFFEQ